MEFGEHLEYFRDIEEDTGHTPKPLAERPVLPEYLEITLEAFHLLSAGRSYGFGCANPIATRDILAMAPFAETESALRFLRVIRKMDALFLATLERKQSEKTRKPSK